MVVLLLEMFSWTFAKRAFILPTTNIETMLWNTAEVLAGYGPTANQK